MRRLNITFLSSFLAFLLVASSNAQEVFHFETAAKLDNSINSEHEETSPVYDEVNGLIYFTRTFYPDNVGGIKSGQDIWSARLKGNKWDSASNVYPELNNQLNNSVIGLSNDGNELFLLSTYQKKRSLQKGFSKSVKIAQEWKTPSKLSIPSLDITGDFYGGWLNRDGNILIISMEGKESLGEEDLYISIKQDGKWSKPEWLGAEINSAGYEISPVLTHDNQTLVFGSNGHEGAGDCDIFYSTRQDSSWLNWSKPINLGAPINSAKFDAFPHFAGERFYFASNRDSEFNDIFLSYDLMYFQEADTFRLAVHYYKTDLSGLKVDVLDNRGDSIGTYTTDENGILKVPGLKQDATYRMVPRSVDVDLKRFNFYSLNKESARVEKIDLGEDGTMLITGMSEDKMNVLQPIKELDLKAGMQGIFELDNAPVQSVMLALVNEDGDDIQYSKTDNLGRFAFAETDDSLKLGIRVLTQLEYLKSNGVIFFTDKDDNKLFKAGLNQNGLFNYQKLEAQQLAKLKMLAQMDKGMSGEQKGVYKYENLAKAGVTLFLYDENDNLIETVVTDENGHFVFTKLKPDQPFSIKTSDMEDTELSAGMLMLFDKNGNEVDLFTFAKDGSGFKYEPLSKEIIAGLDLINTDEGGSIAGSEEKGVFSTGMFKFQSLPKEGVRLKLLDENDNVIETVMTDKNGQFVFSMLNGEKAYRIVAETLDGQLLDGSELYFVGQNGQVISAKADSENRFSYDKLNPDYFFSIAEMNEGETKLLLTESFKDVSGVFKFKNLPKEGVKLLLMDEDGNVIQTVITDKDGNFKFDQLAREQTFVIRLSEEDEGMMVESSLDLISDEGEEFTQEMEENGEFAFKTLPNQRAMKLSLSDSKDSSLDASKFLDQESEAQELSEPLIEKQIVPSDPDMFKGDMNLHSIKFMFNSIRVSERDRYNINKLVLPQLRKSSEPILIVGYSCNIGSQKEIDHISIMRANAVKEYLIGMGVDENRLEVNGVGTVLAAEDDSYENRVAKRKVDILILRR